MNSTVYLYSMNKNEIEKFLSCFFQKDIVLDKNEWEYIYENPVDMAAIIGAFIDNTDKYKITMWVSIDKGFSINVTDHNADQIIKYLYERFPY